jgi:predicted RNase H-like HicB family nuclease
MVLHVETEAETDGRWIAEVVELPGAMTYGANEKEAFDLAVALALRVLTERHARHAGLTPDDL